MTNCEDAAAAEVIFSITGGREGRIVSYHPPVTVRFSPEAYRYMRYKTIYYRDSNTITANLKGRLVFDKVVDKNPGIAIIDEYLGEFQYYDRQRSSYGHNNFISYLIDFSTNINLATLDSGIVQFTNPSLNYPYLLDRDYSKTFPSQKNVFIVEDTLEVLYAQSYPKGLIPTWEVNCISCPDGLCPIKKEEEKIACIDFPKVINNLNNASRKIDSIYG